MEVGRIPVLSLPRRGMACRREEQKAWRQARMGGNENQEERLWESYLGEMQFFARSFASVYHKDNL